MDHLDQDAREARESLYQQLIMERARVPLHAGELDPADAAADGNNPFCGDMVHVTAMLSPDGRATQVLHRTRGCAICMASADLMAESVQGLDRPAIVSLFDRFAAMLNTGVADDSTQTALGSPTLASPTLGLLGAFENLYEYRSRIRCATLPWMALLEALGSERTR